MDDDELLALIDERIHVWQTFPSDDHSHDQAVIGELRVLRDRLTVERNYLMTRSGAYGCVTA